MYSDTGMWSELTIMIHTHQRYILLIH